MKTIDKIPVTKIQRATKLVSTGAKVGVNYLKYYGDKLVNTENLKDDRQKEFYQKWKKSKRTLRGD